MAQARSYHQYCAVARGLDVVGERYKDLLEGLPGIGTNLLAARLRDLQAAGVVRRGVLPPPAGSAVYELTETGQALEPAILAIGRWGGRFLGRPRESDAVLPNAYFVAMRAAFQPRAAAGVSETYLFRIGGQEFEVRVEDGRCATRQGASGAPDAMLTLDVGSLNALLWGELAPGEALASGRVRVEGDPRALERFVGMFRLGQAAASSSSA
jgi:DNA-binding HxlR family transcriptional regulator/putative sterol carrier protein